VAPRVFDTGYSTAARDTTRSPIVNHGPARPAAEGDTAERDAVLARTTAGRSLGGTHRRPVETCRSRSRVRRLGGQAEVAQLDDLIEDVSIARGCPRDQHNAGLESAEDDDAAETAARGSGLTPEDVEVLDGFMAEEPSQSVRWNVEFAVTGESRTMRCRG
jgi:hypothetical protein